MKSEGLLRHVLVAFLLTLAVYVAVYAGCEHNRTRKGPWSVAFATAGSSPALVINQPTLALTNVQILFLGLPAPTNAPSTIVFSQPKPVPFVVPFGSCIFMDSTFLPGTLTFRLFGHEIELLPRVLIIDHEEHPWVSGSTITLQPVLAPTKATGP